MQYAQIFRYSIDLTAAEYQKQFVEPYAQGIADAPGLVRKTWMANFETGEFASFYLWANKDAMDAFMGSPAIAGVAKLTFLKDLVVTSIPVAEVASRVTSGV